MDKQFDDALKENWEGVSQSAIMIQLYAPDMADFVKDPWPAIQLAIAILQNKPILICAKEGQLIPGKLLAMADTIIFYKNMENLQEQMTQVLPRMVEDAEKAATSAQ